MKGSNGAHALLTFLLTSITFWLLWPYTQVALNSPSDALTEYLYWGSYIIIVLFSSLVVPAIIASSSDENGITLLNTFQGMGVWGLMVIFNFISFPIFNAVVNIFTGIQSNPNGGILLSTMQNGSLIVQLISFTYIAVIFLTLYIAPLFVTFNPGIVDDLKEVIS